MEHQRNSDQALGAFRDVRGRSGNIPEPMVAHKRTPTHPIGLSVKSRWEKINQFDYYPKIIFGFFNEHITYV